MRARERDLVAATRSLFDERGMQAAQVEEIARAAGIARGLVYRHFSSKEELYVLTVTHYLDELAELLEAAVAGGSDPTDRLERCSQAFARYCTRYPAFLDASQALMRRHAMELNEIVSDMVWLQLGQSMARCLGCLAEVLRDGAEAGAFRVEDPDYMANLLWTQSLGMMHLARIRVGVRRDAPGIPALFSITQDQVVESCVRGALLLVGASARGRPRSAPA
ncbi:MAG TPA: helix-turn-helix domain-containing protein [Thermoleophilaceae bacterium]